MIRATLAMLCAAGGCFGCQVHVSIGPVAPDVPAWVESGCRDTTAPEACMLAEQPRRHVEVRGASSVHWARLSGDGSLLVVSIGTQPPDGSETSFVAAFDLDGQREIWRVQLADGGRIRAEDCFVLPSGVALVTPAADGVPLAVAVLDRRTGALKWQRSTDDKAELGGAFGGQDTPSVAGVVSADERNDFVITADSRWVHVLDGDSGQILASVRVSHPEGKNEPLVYWTSTSAYVVDSGVARIARTGPKRVWWQPLPTYARDLRGIDSALAASGMSVAGSLALSAMLGRVTGLVVVPTGDWTDDYEFGRTSNPVEVDGLACLGSLGVVSCFDATSGALAWSRRFPVTQFRALAARPGSLCALAGGFYVHQKGAVRTLKESPFRALYCLNPSDGAPLPGFATPFSTNQPGVSLTREQLAAYDPTADDSSLVAHGMPSSEKSPLLGALAAAESGILVSAGPRVQRLDLPTGAATSTTDLGDIGMVTQLAWAGDTVVASAHGGYAGFDAATGALRWKTPFPVTRLPLMDFSNHDPSGLVRRSVPLGPTIGEAGTDDPNTGTYWLLPEMRTLVASGTDGKLAGISLDDGTVRWRLATQGRVAIDGSPGSPSIVVVSGAHVRVYRLPARGTGTPPQPAR
jgi:outer membrane protein assembly factor BamB